jgi:GT2 family glycosyltransferase
MREQPLVSVIIPNYNHARTLGLCLEAVTRQTYPAIETIVVDDGSTDDSVAVASRHARVRVLTSSVNGGAAAARNLGAEGARGEILFFLDADVVLDADAVANAVSVLVARPEVGAICGVYRMEGLFPDRFIKRYRAIQQGVWFNDVEGRIPALHSALSAIRAELFRRVGPFDARLSWTEDQDYGFRVNARSEVHATRAIRGSHEHDATIGTVLTKVFQRTRLGAPGWLRHSSLPGGAATGARAFASGCVLAAVLSLPLGLLSPWLLLAPVALVGLGIALDSRTYGAAYRRHGVWFGLRFTAVHLLVVLTSAVAAGVGILQGVLQGVLSPDRARARSRPGLKTPG